MSAAVIVHSLMPDRTIRCEAKAGHTTAEARNVTCKRCLSMMETAKRAADLQRIPPERWP